MTTMTDTTSTRTKGPVFSAGQFTATQYATAADKAAFANRFVRFVERGFKETIFTRRFYQQLSMMFGHIAHFDQAGFYGVWCTTTERRARFLRNVVDHEGRYQFGDRASFTWCDVEQVLARWVKEQGWAARYEQQVKAEREAEERKQLQALQAKYPDGSGQVHDCEIGCRSEQALNEIRNIFIDEEGRWRELQSCADAVGAVCLVLSMHGMGGKDQGEEGEG